MYLDSRHIHIYIHIDVYLLVVYWLFNLFVHTYRHKERHRQTDRQTERQRDRQTQTTGLELMAAPPCFCNFEGVWGKALRDRYRESSM